MASSGRVKTLTIDGRPCSARSGESVLQVAKENNIFIPTLCHMEGLSNVGACRMCLVEIKGSKKLVPACVTRVFEGMEVATDTEQIQKYRKLILALLFSERNHICPVCVSNGHCELQHLSQKLGLDHIHVPYLYPVTDVDASHERFVNDQSRCILCSRCVRVCDEIEGAHTWDIMGRGVDCKIISDLNQPWGESESCTSCGKCVHVCPTGALFESGKATAEMTKRQFLPYLSLMRGEKNQND